VQLAASVGYWIQLFIQRVVIPITISADIFLFADKNLYSPRVFIDPIFVTKYFAVGAVAV
jgi:hypothetical protein